MRKFLLSLIVAGVIMAIAPPVLAQNVPFDGAGAGKTGWTTWKREKLSKNQSLLRYCSREYYKNGRFMKSESKIIRIYQFC